MERNSLFKLYKEFIEFDKDFYLKTPISLDKSIKLKKSFLSRYYSIYHKPTFVEFLKVVRDFVFSKNASDVFGKGSFDEAQIASMLFFLEEKGIIKFDRNGNLSSEEKFKKIFFKELS
ncbi:MAG TPA: hypothetical protein ENF38_00325, partial [Candidatus Aenigmarchaeota archaeon]|nr:hypothetical protein [Candidatus Aenigmarchaeota archaeon]